MRWGIFPLLASLETLLGLPQAALWGKWVLTVRLYNLFVKGSEN